MDEAPASYGVVSDTYCPDAYSDRKRADILIVIDDSPSMIAFAPTLAENFEDFEALFHNPQVEVDYRIAVTTTSVPGPGCPLEEPPAFRTDTCRSHLDDFIVEPSAEAPVGGDATDICESTCGIDNFETEPTTIAGSPEAHPRPWIERNDLLEDNLPEGVSLAEALSCIGLRGGGGCEFESPLEAAMRAIDASFDHDDPGHGFLRDDAIPVILFITDEDDCSVGPGGGDIFSPDGSQVFWPDPDSPEPQSGICWNAGTRCEPAEGNWLDCVPVMRDGAGAETNDPTEAALHPVDRYSQRLQGLEDVRRETLPDVEVVVSVVAGANDSGELWFMSAEDTPWEEDDAFGIGPGCSADGEPYEAGSRVASPGLRLHTLAESMEGSTYSVCADDYTMGLHGLFTWVGPGPPRYCVDGCVADADPATPVVEHDCVVSELRPGEEDPRVLPECLRQDGEYVFEDDNWVQPGDQTDACAVFLTDREEFTESIYDDLSPECDESANLEVRVARRTGHPAPIDTCLRVRCSESADACEPPGDRS